MKQILHIVRFLHVSDSRDEPDKTDENYDWLCRTRTTFDKLNTKETKSVWDKILHDMLF
jgi:hypothetical protein